jgi:8-oxo-dGTP pyrophosphatase MutT (NUDIX family)
MCEPAFDAIRAALSAWASDADDPPVGRDPVIEAAVAVLLRPARTGASDPADPVPVAATTRGGDNVAAPPLDLLLIKRAAHPRDPWSGHMALPGGRRDDDDASLAWTAIRETREETGVRLPGPASRGFLGTLPLVAPQSRRLPAMRISPFVFAVDAGVEATVASDEVADVHWISLARLRNPATRNTVPIRFPDATRRFPCYQVAGEAVWGLTYRILTDLLERLPGE